MPSSPSPFHRAFARYKDLTNLDALIASSQKPLRKCVRVNTLKCSVEDFQKYAKAHGWELEPIPWCTEGFFIDREDRSSPLGKDLLHILGGFYIQEASSMLPPTLLAVEPHETVLDMSAAPGSKTTQLAAVMHNTGTLVANDVQEKRLWALLNNTQRCGLLNVLVTRKVGQWFAGNMTGMFDRVLCDAPCTAQGTARKDSDALTYCSLENIGKMAKVQRELLESAIHACRVGGTIVYSTCTLTPEENEGVIRSILNKFCDQVIVDAIENDEDLAIDQSILQKAIADSHRVQEMMDTEEGTKTPRFSALRLWPQTFDTEGFFAVRLKKVARTKERAEWEKKPHQYAVLPNRRMDDLASQLMSRYGTAFFHDDEVLIESREQLFVVPKKLLTFKLPLVPYYTGLPFGKLADRDGGVRLSHDILTLRGGEAVKNTYTLSEDEVRTFLSGGTLTPINHDCTDGDILLRFDHASLSSPLTIGKGMLKDGSILNRLPRDMVQLFAGR